MSYALVQRIREHLERVLESENSKLKCSTDCWTKSHAIFWIVLGTVKR